MSKLRKDHLKHQSARGILPMALGRLSRALTLIRTHCGNGRDLRLPHYAPCSMTYATAALPQVAGSLAAWIPTFAGLVKSDTGETIADTLAFVEVPNTSTLPHSSRYLRLIANLHLSLPKAPLA